MEWRHVGKPSWVCRISMPQRSSHGLKCWKRKNKEKFPTAPQRLSAIPAGPTHTTLTQQPMMALQFNWLGTRLCLFKTTYFYSHRRSRSPYCLIAELMLHVYSKTKELFDKKPDNWWRGMCAVLQMILNFPSFLPSVNKRFPKQSCIWDDQ